MRRLGELGDGAQGDLARPALQPTTGPEALGDGGAAWAGVQAADGRAVVAVFLQQAECVGAVGDGAGI